MRDYTIREFIKRQKTIRNFRCHYHTILMSFELHYLAGRSDFIFTW